MEPTTPTGKAWAVRLRERESFVRDEILALVVQVEVEAVALERERLRERARVMFHERRKWTREQYVASYSLLADPEPVR